MTQPQSRPSIIAFPVLRAAGALATALACGTALAAGSVLDDPIATTRVPDGTTTITQTREQNAVTSVQVRRGDNVYNVTPAEQIPANLGGGRAATWEIFQFKPRRADDRRAAPPPN
ncbi:MAG: hypothetical protein RL404_2777 [Pseudomonadota bacterium]|jgi:hypothetical protein